MSDFEQQLSEALERGAQAAPAPIGLAEAARVRARRHRRSRLAWAGTVAALAVAVPAGVVALDGGSGRPGHGPAAPATGASTATDPQQSEGSVTGHRWESWHGVELQVPDSWGYGALSTWCIAGPGGAPSQPEPVVERPGVVADIACRPTSGYGVSFAAASPDSNDWPVAGQTGGKAWPIGAYVGARVVGDVWVTVSAADAGVAQAVLSSARKISDQDPNGCSPSADSPSHYPETGTMAICRYDGSGALEQSELLTGDDAAAAAAALAAAPLDTRRGPHCTPPHDPATTVIFMRSEDVTGRVELGGSCWSDDRVYVGDEADVLTSDVLYWALSPGWNGYVDGDVPLPPKLRER